MSEPIQRHGAWWQQQTDGSWLRWNADAGAWEPQTGPPPPPPAPEVIRPAATSRTWGTARSPSALFNPFGDRRVLAAIGGAIAIVLVLATLTFAGGGGDPKPPVSVDPAGASAVGRNDSKPQFIAKADALCAKALRRQLRLEPALNGDQLVTTLERSRAIARDLMKKLRALKRPAEDHKMLKRLFKIGDRAVAMHDELIAAAQASDLATIQSLVAEAERLERRSTVLALKYGFDDCSKTVDDL